MDVCLNPGGMAVHRLCLQLREPIDRVASLYDYRRSGKSGGYTPFAKMAGKEQNDWDFNTCVRRKESCRVYEVLVESQMDEVRLQPRCAMTMSTHKSAL